MDYFHNLIPESVVPISKNNIQQKFVLILTLEYRIQILQIQAEIQAEIQSQFFKNSIIKLNFLHRKQFFQLLKIFIL